MIKVVLLKKLPKKEICFMNLHKDKFPLIPTNTRTSAVLCDAFPDTSQTLRTADSDVICSHRRPEPATLSP